MAKLAAGKSLLSVPLFDRQHEDLERLAEKHGVARGGKPSKPGLVAAIADGKFELIPRTEPHGPIEAEVMEFINRQQPFKLAYTDAGSRYIEFDFLYADRVKREGRYYLEGWAVSSQRNFDIPQLQYNWSLRFDRIQAELTPIPGGWKKTGLDSIEVELALTGGLAFGYQKRDADIAERRDGSTRIITRRITNTFWFIREVLAYGGNCTVRSPDAVVKLVIGELAKALDNYG